jgi:hypothetical protein
LLNRCRWEKEQLQNESKAKDELIATLSKRNAALESAQTHFASPQLYPQTNSQPLEHTISRLEQFIKEQAF